MNDMGQKIAKKRRDLGMTQEEFAEKMHVTRQTVSRWESGAVLPDIEKLSDLASILSVSCDYLLKDDVKEEGGAPAGGVSRLLRGIVGKTVRLSFFDEEADVDLYNVDCTVLGFEGHWMKLAAQMKKGRIEKLIPVSSVRAIDLVQKEEQA